MRCKPVELFIILVTKFLSAITSLTKSIIKNEWKGVIENNGNDVFNSHLEILSTVTIKNMYRRVKVSGWVYHDAKCVYLILILIEISTI